MVRALGDAETHVCYLNVAIGAAKDVLRPNVTMQYVELMHGLQTESNLVKAELDEFFRDIAALSLLDVTIEVATLHEFEEHPEAILVVVDFFPFNDLLAVI